MVSLFGLSVTRITTAGAVSRFRLRFPRTPRCSGSRLSWRGDRSSCVAVEKTENGRRSRWFIAEATSLRPMRRRLRRLAGVVPPPHALNRTRACANDGGGAAHLAPKATTSRRCRTPRRPGSTTDMVASARRPTVSRRRSPWRVDGQSRDHASAGPAWSTRIALRGRRDAELLHVHTALLRRDTPANWAEFAGLRRAIRNPRHAPFCVDGLFCTATGQEVRTTGGSCRIIGMGTSSWAIGSATASCTRPRRPARATSMRERGLQRERLVEGDPSLLNSFQ